MIDSLTYYIATSKECSFEKCEPIESRFHSKIFRLKDDFLKITFLEPQKCLEDAILEVKDDLLSWEIQWNLKLRRGTIRFLLRSFSEVSDNQESNAKTGSFHIFQQSSVNAEGFATNVINAYPPIPSTFVYDEQMNELYRRYRNYVEGKEPLLSFSNLLYTEIEKGMLFFKAYQEKELRISTGLLNKLKANNLGSMIEKRKASSQHKNIALTQKERLDIERAIRLIMIRLSEYSSGQRDYNEINCGDLGKDFLI